MATLNVLERDNVTALLAAAGAKLREGMIAAGTKHGFSLRYTGPDAMPFLTFAEETNFFRSQAFCRQAMQLGAFLHPHHNWFLCADFGAVDLAETLEIADRAFAEVREEFP